jgi:hypothetical protein
MAAKEGSSKFCFVNKVKSKNYTLFIGWAIPCNFWRVVLTNSLFSSGVFSFLNSAAKE